MVRKEIEYATFSIIFPKREMVLGKMFQKKVFTHDHCYFNQYIFKKGEGFKFLIKCITEKPDKLPHLKIVNNMNNEYSIDKFLNILNYCVLYEN